MLLALLAPTLTLTTVETGPAPHFVPTLAACEKTDDGQLRGRTIRDGDYDVMAIRDCVANEQLVSLGIHTTDTWWVIPGAPIHYDAAHMSNAPLHIRPRAQAITRGTLADGAHAMVFRIEAVYEAICDVAGCGDDEKYVSQTVLVCALPREATMDRAVTCGRIAHRCPAAGCAAVTLERGVLRVGSESTIVDG